MNPNRIHLFAIILLLSLKGLNAQMGQWTDYLPYSNASHVEEGDNVIYCASRSSLFYYNLSDNSVNKVSKVNGLTEVLISDIAYSSENKVLVIAYSSSNIDLLYKNGKIVNIAEIKNKSNLPNKLINSVKCIGSKAYFACSFGITVFDLTKLEFIDTYILGEEGKTLPVNDICEDETYIYAATDNGLYWADKTNKFLNNYINWSKRTDVPNPDRKLFAVETFNGSIFVLCRYDWGVYNVRFQKNGTWQNVDLNGYDGYMHKHNNNLFVCFRNGIYGFDANLNVSRVIDNKNLNTDAIKVNTDFYYTTDTLGLTVVKNGEYNSFAPSGPHSNSAFKLQILNSNIYLVGGSANARWHKTYRWPVLASRINNSWVNLSAFNKLDDYRDFVNVAVNPYNNDYVYYASIVGKGLIETNKGVITNVYNSDNSPLQAWSFDQQFKTYGLLFDNNSNLWVTNIDESGLDRKQNPLLILTKNKKWITPKFDDLNHKFGPLMLDSRNRVWCLLRETDGILVYDTKNTIENLNDDVMKIFPLTVSEGEISTTRVNCMVEDYDGTIWVGTDLGPVMYSVSHDFFDKETPTASRVKVAFKNRTDNSAAYLLEKDKINSIAIDGGNRKWIATATSGVYLLSPDGTKEIHHFTEENSPLLSSIVYDVAIDHTNGEVFFATENGLISYNSDATGASDEFGKVYAYPNPVKPDFDGDITIVNLAQNANVKITDIAGNLVYETTANGGTATWNGRTLTGNKVYTGIYLIFCVNADGSKTYVSKLLFVR